MLVEEENQECKKLRRSDIFLKSNPSTGLICRPYGALIMYYDISSNIFFYEAFYLKALFNRSAIRSTMIRTLK